MLLLSLLLATAFAAEPPNRYSCNLIVVAEDIPDGGVGEVPFVVSAIPNGKHGGEERPFTFGPNVIRVQAHARWRGLTWTRGQKVVTSSVIASELDLPGSVVLHTTNPENDQDTAALTCQPL